MLKKVKSHINGILYIDEVTHLFAIGIVRPVRLEQLHLTRVPDLGVGLIDHRSHVALMIFTRAKDVEVLQPDYVAEVSVGFGP